MTILLRDSQGSFSKLYISLHKTVFERITSDIVKMDEKNLVIEVVEARSLPAADLTGFCDPFAKVYLGSKKIGSTNSIPECLNPRWNSIFQYRHEADFSDEIRVEIYDKDFGVNDLLGFVSIDSAVFRNGKWTNRWYRLCAGEEEKPSKGYVRLKIQFANPNDQFFNPGLYDPTGADEDENERKRKREEWINKKRALLGQQTVVEERQISHEDAWKQNQAVIRRQIDINQGKEVEEPEILSMEESLSSRLNSSVKLEFRQEFLSSMTRQQYQNFQQMSPQEQETSFEQFIATKPKNTPSSPLFASIPM